MPIPDYQQCMLPLLEFSKDGAEHRLKEAIEAVSDRFKLTEFERTELLPSGRQPVIANRIGWASTYLKNAGLLSSPRRGYFQITPRGQSVLASRPAQINSKFLEQFPGFLEFGAVRRSTIEDQSRPQVDSPQTETPDEALQKAYERLRSELAAEILSSLKTCDPALFERIVVEVLVEMGYGGSRLDAAKAIGRSGDEGIDGIIKEDHLGLDSIYIQAKRWQSTVGRPEIQKFAGALQGQRARKGVFITTSEFSKDASDYVSRIDSKIVLIDGEMLARLMIDFSVGVTSVANYEVKRIDTDYFLDD